MKKCISSLVFAMQPMYRKATFRLADTHTISTEIHQTYI